MALDPARLTLEAAQLAASAVYLVVGAIVIRRPVEPHDRLALFGFAAWWFGIAALGIFTTPFGLGVEIATLGLAAYRFVVYASFVIIFFALAGLLYYLLYLYTGNKELWQHVVGFYIAMAVLVVWLVEGFGPYVDRAGGAPEVAFGTPHPTWLTLLFALGVAVPPLVAAVAYMFLFFRVPDRPSRYRIALVSLGIILWFGYSTANALLDAAVEGHQGGGLVGDAISQGLGLLASVLALFAFAPPRRVKRWLARGAAAPDEAPEEVQAG